MGSDKGCKSSIQSDNFIESYRVHGRQTDRHFRKNRFFLIEGVSKCKDEIKIQRVILDIKPMHSHMMSMRNYTWFICLIPIIFTSATIQIFSLEVKKKNDYLRAWYGIADFRTFIYKGSLLNFFRTFLETLIVSYLPKLIF